MGVAQSLSLIHQRIQTAAYRVERNPKEITLVVVTKGVPIGPIREAVAVGEMTLGESRIQEALPKIASISGNIKWHLIGSLQRNKVRQAVGVFELIYSVDRRALAEEISRQAEKKGVVQKVLIQVNVAGEQSKSGISIEDALELVNAVREMPNLIVKGLMTIPPLPQDPEDSRPYYRSLRVLGEEIEEATGVPNEGLSMGMSRDFEIAVEEGATAIRVGTAIFS